MLKSIQKCQIGLVMTVSIAEFKGFCEAQCHIEEVRAYCTQLASDLGIADEELSELLVNEFGTIYCSDNELCEKFGFYNETDMLLDISEIAVLTELNYFEIFQKINERLHEMATGTEGGFYGGSEDGIIFIDLKKLSGEFGVTF